MVKVYDECRLWGLVGLASKSGVNLSALGDAMITPIVFLIYKRPDLARKVWAEIRKAKPPILLVVADGPRNETERAACDETRALVEQVDWPCDVRRNYSNSNMGCKHRPASGLKWVFEQVEEAIILEDDCLPDPSFFPFCDELLERYRHDERVGMICGSNFHPDPQAAFSYFSSIYPRVWGWATWRRAWKFYDLAMTQWPLVRDGLWMGKLFTTENEAARMSKRWDELYKGEINTWDGQWFYSMRVRGYSCLVPSTNLVTNIGIGADATHTTHSGCDYADAPSSPMKFPLRHPPFLAVDRASDARHFRTVYMPPLWPSIKGQIMNRHWYGKLVRQIPIVGRLWSLMRPISRVATGVSGKR